ncbi:MAG TPA: lysylphosphatidylglycerol synthase transmembrane domain-containing protein [Anaerolineales bacterium]|jgi:uncharacterized membrane protein YbhN (UPF0104 family)|nr:lysylphosphatidylglycerol synthase transmembrane domain-containing protein [Anaerolineales bacterium]
MSDWLSGNRRFFLRLIGTLLAIGLIVILVKGEGWNEILDALKKISPMQIVLTLLLMLISRFFVVLRWHVLLRSGGVKISIWDTTALTFTGLFANNFLPTTIGGDVVRLAGVMQLGYDRAISVASLAADRLIGMIGMLFTLPLGLVPAFGGLSPSASHSIVLSVFFQRIRDFIKRTLQTFSIWLKNPLSLMVALICTWGNMVFVFITLYILVHDLGGNADFWLIAGLWTLAYFVTLVPISINGYGVQELSLTFLLSSVANLGTGISLATAVLIRILYLAVSLVGAVYLPAILAALDTDRVPEKNRQ